MPVRTLHWFLVDRFWQAGFCASSACLPTPNDDLFLTQYG
jgi:hypothetical protein